MVALEIGDVLMEHASEECAKVVASYLILREVNDAYCVLDMYDGKIHDGWYVGSAKSYLRTRNVTVVKRATMDGA